MTDPGGGSTGRQQAVSETFRIQHPAAIVEEVRRAKAGHSRRFRTVFILTWAVLVGGLALLIAFSGRVHPEFIQEYGPLFIGGIPLTIGAPSSAPAAAIRRLAVAIVGDAPRETAPATAQVPIDKSRKPLLRGLRRR